MRLDCAMLYVREFRRMKDFYARLLQAQPAECTDTWALFKAEGTALALHAIPAEYAPAPQSRETNPVKLIFAVDDVPGERARLGSFGVTIIQHPWQKDKEAFDALDPEGNIFQIAAVGHPA